MNLRWAIKKINTITIKQIKIDDSLLDLAKELPLTVDYDKLRSKYIVDNAQFNIFAINNEFDVAIEDIKEQIGMLWKGYVEEDISNLTDWSNPRKKLKNLIEA